MLQPSSRPLRQLWWVLVALVSMGISGWAGAQTSAADAAAIFGGLTAEQQQAVLERLGSQSGASGSRASQMPGGPDRSTESSRDTNRRSTVRAGTSDATSRPLQAGDTVLVNLTIRRQQIATGVPVAPSEPGTAAPSASNALATPQLLPMGPEIELTGSQREVAQNLMRQIHEYNPYVLDHRGALLLPGFDPIFVAGLSDEQASERVSAEPAFVNLHAKITRLPVQKPGAEGLRPFGYDLFDSSPSTFAPVTNVPVPADYIVGAGDVLQVQLYGSENRLLNLVVNRDGRINFPQLGPIDVSGRRFSEVRAEIEQRVSKQMIGVNASLSMGDTRAIQVFVLGEAVAPGSYTVSGLATMTTALFVSGGVKPIGSLRDIQLKRQGELVRRLDLYDLLLRGDTSNDAKLQPGDVIFIPAVGPTVAVSGEVRRPAIYEIKGAQTAAEVVTMAGGLTTEADPGLVSLTRIDQQRKRVVLDVDLISPAATPQDLRKGDLLHVGRLRPTLDSGIVLQGHVFRPARFAWRDGLRLSDVIRSVDELKPDADQHYILIRREVPPDRRIAVLSADLAVALRAPGSEADVLLQPRDQLTVFDLGTGRERIIAPLMNELAVQGGYERPTERVSIRGRVKVPGDYPFEPHMKVADLIRAGGTLDAAAYGGKAELSRYIIVDGQVRRTEVIPIDLAAALSGDPAANLELQPFDGLFVKEISGWSKQEQITLRGEVRFPGIYPIREGETLRSVIERAGGLTEQAFADGSVFTREDLREREQVQLDRLADRMQNDLAAMALMAARGGQGSPQQSYAMGETLLSQLKTTEAVGRLVINLDEALKAAPGSANELILRNNDLLVVPKRSQEVTVLGEVQTATSHLYNPDLSRKEYIDLSGGYTRQADKRHVYVVRANGSVVANPSGGLFRAAAGIRTGDTIVVPLNTDRMPQLPLWQSVTQILYNIAIAVAAVNAL